MTLRTSQKTAPRRPYGLSFSLEELVEAKWWTQRAQLSLEVVLDHVMDGAEFEEILVVGSADGRRRVLTVWTTGASLYAQAPNGRPRAYATLALALESARMRSIRRQPWRFF